MLEDLVNVNLDNLRESFRCKTPGKLKMGRPDRRKRYPLQKLLQLLQDWGANPNVQVSRIKQAREGLEYRNPGPSLLVLTRLFRGHLKDECV